MMVKKLLLNRERREVNPKKDRDRQTFNEMIMDRDTRFEKRKRRNRSGGTLTPSDSKTKMRLKQLD